MRSMALSFGLVCIACVSVHGQQQESKLNRLLGRTPSVANSILYVHVPSMQRLMDQANYDSPLSDEIEEVWAISNLDTTSLMPQWEVGYASLKKTLDVRQLADELGGYVDEVDGIQVARMPQQTYLTSVADGLGFMRPANRVLMARWISATDGSAMVPKYLAEQSLQPERFLSLLFAVDLENVLSPVALESKIDVLESIGNADTGNVAQVMASIRGVSIIVGRQSLDQCILAVDFQDSPAMLAPFAREMLNEILNRNGTAAPEVLTWDVKVDGNKLAFQGSISENTLDGVLNIFSVRGQADTVADAMSRTEEIDGPRAYESKKYFDRVLGLIERVRKYDAQTTGYRAKWNDQNARRIDELSIVGVDDELAAYGRQVSGLLRANAAAIRGVNVQAGQIQASQSLSGGYGYYGNSYYGYGGYGYYDPNSTTDYQQVTGAQARMQGFGSFRNTMTQIDELTADIRQKMTRKYNTAF